MSNPTRWACCLLFAAMPSFAVTTLTCESNEGKTYCPADTRGGVKIAKRIGAGDCKYGETWTYDLGGVWVDRLCRAEFELGDPPKGRPWKPVPVTERIVCESAAGLARTTCPIDAGGGARVLRDLSAGRCVEGRSWGAATEGIWVASGCRAEFEATRGWPLGKGSELLPPPPPVQPITDEIAQAECQQRVADRILREQRVGIAFAFPPRVLRAADGRTLVVEGRGRVELVGGPRSIPYSCSFEVVTGGPPTVDYAWN